MVGPEWRRLAAFRGDGTNDPSYARPVINGRLALSEQERITRLFPLGTTLSQQGR
jgi:hypothetical protein